MFETYRSVILTSRKAKKRYCHWNSFTLTISFFPKTQSFDLSSRFQSHCFFLYEFCRLKNYLFFSWHQSPDRLQAPKSATNIGLAQYWKEIFKLDIFHQGLNWKSCSRTGVFDWIIINLFLLPEFWYSKNAKKVLIVLINLSFNFLSTRNNWLQFFYQMLKRKFFSCRQTLDWKFV